MKKKIKEGDLVFVRPTLSENPQLGFVWKKEKKLHKYVVDPRVPELTKETKQNYFSVWVFLWARTQQFLAEELSLLDYE